MSYNESNFIYIKTTSMEKYYDNLVKAEYICEYFPMITKIIVRKVIEGFVKDIAEKHTLESNIGAWDLLNSIKLNSNISLPEEIYNCIEIILVNGYEHPSRKNKNKKNSKHPIEVLETIHKVLCWYLKETEAKKMILIENLSFRAPNTIEYSQKEINKVKDDILLKNNQINNLRQKIIGLGSQWNRISEINKVIIIIKEEKAYLESIQISLIEKIQVQKDQVLDVENNFKAIAKKIEQLAENCNEIQELVFSTENQLVKAEIKKQEVKNLVNELDEKDQSIKRMEQTLDEEISTVRKAYESLAKLSTQYQDVLETMEFSYDKELKKILEVKINNVTMQISFEDRIFNENILNYTKNIAETKRKIAIFKELLNENIKREIKYDLFYKGFLKLGDRELRIIYTMITNTYNLISKSRELLLKSGEDDFLDAINNNLKELKDVNDDEIKLVLYYKLIKLSQVPLGTVHNRRQFIHALDNIVDKAYEILMGRKDFKGRIRKLDSISAYYLEKVISNLKSKNNNLQINDELADKIYNNITRLKQNVESIEREKINYDKFNLDTMSETTIKSSIKLHVFDFISIMIDLGGVSSYKEISSIIFEIERVTVQRPTLKIHEEETLTTSFSNEYFIIRLFLCSGPTFFRKKQQEDLVPLLVIIIMSVNLMSDNYEIGLESYNSMVDLWKRKQGKYNDIYIEEKDQEGRLESLIKEKSELELNCGILLKSYDALVKKYDNYDEEFKNIIINSERIILLPSYRDYYKLLSEKEVVENNIDEAKNKFGTLKSILSPGVWKDQANKIINESNILELEKSLIQEAKEKPYFKKEYKVFEDLKAKIEDINKLINKEKENIKKKDLLIDNINSNISELQRQLNKIKDLYTDIEEGYY